VSEHEGFLVPVLEAMHHRVPVVAFGAAAVPETLGHGGLLLPSKSPELVATAAWRVRSDAALRQRLVDEGAAQLERFSLPNARRRLVEALAPVLS
jgi:glycosyltransferase involved in cell wall biosynthesis